MKYILYVVLAFVVSMTNASANQIEVPNTFIAGTKAVASDVNGNFTTLVRESNSQDLRIQALEKVSVKDQLACHILNSFWITNGRAENCVQSTDIGNVRVLTYQQVIQEGWVITSIGHEHFIFSK